MHVHGKLRGQSLGEASDISPPTRRLFINDRETGTRYLIDTGADLCVYPRTAIRGQARKAAYELAAANGTAIATYGTVTLQLELGLRRTFVWRFVLADVPKAIIGADFLAHYGLLVDLKARQLVDRETGLSARGQVQPSDDTGIRTISGTTRYHQLLARYPEITRPDGRAPQVRHTTKHHIVTTPGPPVTCKPRRHRRFSADKGRPRAYNHHRTPEDRRPPGTGVRCIRHLRWRSSATASQRSLGAARFFLQEAESGPSSLQRLRP